MGRQANKKQVLVYLPEAVHSRLRADSARLGLSMSELVERAIAAWSLRVITRDDEVQESSARMAKKWHPVLKKLAD
jgi:hypothetical protein